MRRRFHERDPLRRIGARSSVLLLLIATFALGAPPAGALIPPNSCFLDDGIAFGTGGTASGYYTFIREAGTQKIQFVTPLGAVYCLDGSVKATVKNVDEIWFVGFSSNETVTIDLSGGPFAPGKTAESNGVSEIEFEIGGGNGTDRLFVNGGPKADSIAFQGLATARLNGDADADIVEITSIERLEIDGNGGNDTVSVTKNVRADVFGGEGDDRITTSGGDDYVVGGPGNDAISTGYGADTLYGEDGNDRLDGGRDGDLLDGGNGADTVLGGDGSDDFPAEEATKAADVYRGGPGHDTVDYSDRSTRVMVDLDGAADDGAQGEGDLVGSDVEQVDGSSGNDKLVGSPGKNTLHGFGGDDVLLGGDGDDSLHGGDGDDRVDGGLGDDALYGSGWSDSDPGSDTLIGADGDDYLVGGAGSDSLNGGWGADSFVEGSAPSGADDIVGGPGRDTVSYSNRVVSISISLDNAANDGAAAEGDNIHADVETLYGGSSHDTITGAAGPQDIYGFAGHDTIIGGGGADGVFGGDGADTLTGGEGTDQLYGGAGNDTVGAVDGAYDYIDCGLDFDTLTKDDVDPSVGCESLA
jgi:Ca2+-binding RTX toxin-like protein